MKRHWIYPYSYKDEFSKKFRFKIQLQNYAASWAELLDGIIGIVSFGFLAGEFYTNCLEKQIMDRFKWVKK